MKDCIGQHKFVQIHTREYPNDSKVCIYLVCEKCGKQIKKTIKP